MLRPIAAWLFLIFILVEVISGSAHSQQTRPQVSEQIETHLLNQPQTFFKMGVSIGVFDNLIPSGTIVRIKRTVDKKSGESQSEKYCLVSSDDMGSYEKHDVHQHWYGTSIQSKVSHLNSKDLADMNASRSKLVSLAEKNAELRSYLSRGDLGYTLDGSISTFADEGLLGASRVPDAKGLTPFSHYMRLMEIVNKICN